MLIRSLEKTEVDFVLHNILYVFVYTYTYVYIYTRHMYIHILMHIHAHRNFEILFLLLRFEVVQTCLALRAYDPKNGRRVQTQARQARILNRQKRNEKHSKASAPFLRSLPSVLCPSRAVLERSTPTENKHTISVSTPQSPTLGTNDDTREGLG